MQRAINVTECNSTASGDIRDSFKKGITLFAHIFRQNDSYLRKNNVNKNEYCYTAGTLITSDPWIDRQDILRLTSPVQLYSLWPPPRFHISPLLLHKIEHFLFLYESETCTHSLLPLLICHKSLPVIRAAVLKYYMKYYIALLAQFSRILYTESIWHIYCNIYTVRTSDFFAGI